MISRLLLASALIAVPLTLPAADWTQYGADSSRSFFVGHDSGLDKHSVSKLKLRWKVKLENVSKELNSLTVPVVSGKYAVVAGSNDELYALDAGSGAVIWHRHLEPVPSTAPKADWLCPNALTATPVIDAEKQVVHALASDGRLYSMRLQTGEDLQAPREFVPPFAKTWSLNLFKGVIYTPTSQACNKVRSAIYAINADGGASRQFLAMRTYGAGIWGRAGVAIDEEGTVFAGTGDGIFDPKSGQYPNTILAVDGSTLQLKDYFTPKNYAWIAKKDLDMGNTSPIVFSYGKKELVAASGKLGVIWLLDAKCMGGDDHMTPLYASPVLANDSASYFGKGFWGAFATRQDNKGRRWLYAPAWGSKTAQTKFKRTNGDAPSGSIMAFQVTGPDTKPELRPMWQSADMAVPAPPVLVNDVLFALSDGDNIDQNDANARLLPSSFRAEHPRGHAVVYALDANTGKTLFSSGSAIPGFSHLSGISVANGTVFAITWDNTVYAFSAN
jgi:outer membrane protein assembly factor BamB